jgi:uncharacterized protein YbjT (DUF2867 family)
MSKETAVQTHKIAVAGATGSAGRHIVDLLERRGHDVVAMSRRSGVDVVTGEGLEAALEGVDTIVDATSNDSPDREAATAFFTASTRNFNEAGARAGVRRLIVVSIIGIDGFKGGYNAAKLVQERAARAAALPVSILRAAQFHELIPRFVEWGKQGDVTYVPDGRTQPVAARAVAGVVADLATGPDEAFAPDAPHLEVAGPREERFAELAKLFVARRGLPLQIEAVTDPSDPDSVLYESGAILPGPGATLAGPTFEEWLDSTS